MSLPCIPCAEPQVCVEGLDEYNLQEETFPDSPFCQHPPCGVMPFIFVACCDGFVTEIENPDGDVYQPAIRRKIEAAMAACERRRAFCVNPPPEPPPGTPKFFFSAPASCTIYCPDGTPFTYTVNSGLFIAETQAQADLLAKQWVCDHAPEQIFCLASLQGCACLNAPFNAVFAASPSKPLKFLLVGGNLPPGLSIPVGVVPSGVLRIQGTPTATGNYPFIIRALDANNNYIDKTYLLKIVGITTSSLPDFTIGTPYSFQLAANGGSGNYLFGVASGSFPDGLGMDANGLITGTPTNLAVNSSITFEVVDTDCENEGPRLIPRASMTTVAVTRTATVIGYEPYIQSIPPKRYKRVDFSGEAYQGILDGNDVLVYSEYDEFTGFSLIDVNGNRISNHQRNVQGRIGDTSQPWYSRGNLYSNTSKDSTGLPADSFYARTPDAFHRNVVSPEGTIDGPVPPVISDPVYPAGSPLIGTIPNNFTQSVAFPQMFPPEAPAIYPALPYVHLNGQFEKWILWLVRLDYHAVVSDEYTDADALSVANVTLSNSNVSRNEPRRVGYTSRYTTVNYSISLTNLVVGQAYRVIVPLHGENGTNSQIIHTFTALSTIHSINGTTPTPPPWVSVEVRSPLVTFA